jgi:urease accessory protein
MERVEEIRPPGHWPSAEERDSITLAYHDRHRRRLRLVAERGTDFLLDLARTILLREGDGLRLSGGGYVRMRAADEPLLEIKATTPEALARLAWHLGNRHLPAEIGAKRILIHRDHVIAGMLRGLGAEVAEVTAPFNPESGAYAALGHPDDHGHEHEHEHGADHAHHGHRHD